MFPAVENSGCQAFAVPTPTSKTRRSKAASAAPSDFLMTTVIAYRPERASSNPPRNTSMSTALRGRVLRLEFPEELDGADWDGPVYVMLEGEPKNLQPTDRSPFVQDDGERVPAWLCKIVATLSNVDVSSLSAGQRAYLTESVWIPYWRFTQPHRDLSRELDERPLLTVFRFARISRYFMASPGDDTKLILQTPGVHVCCQVLTYRSSASVSLVDDIDVIMEPGSGFICIVALRRYVTDDPVIVACPLAELQERTISAVEFMLGYGHGLATAAAPAPFATGWEAFTAAAPSDPISTRAQLVSSFLTADPVVGSSIDTGTVPVSYVTPQGVVANQIPVDYAIKLATPTGRVADEVTETEVDAPLRVPLGGPLLRRDAVTLTEVPHPGPVTSASTTVVPSRTTSVVLSTTARAPGVTGAPINDRRTVPGTTTDGIPGLTASERLLYAMFQEQREENRRNQEAATRQFDLVNQQLSQFAQAMSNIQQQFTESRPQLQAQPVLQLGAQVASLGEPTSANNPPLPASNPVSARGAEPRSPRRHRTGATYDADNDDIGRHRDDRGRSRHRDDRERSRSPRPQQRDRSRRSGSPLALRFGRSDRSRSRDRSPQGRRPTGNDRFRPSTNELHVNQNARVGPRQGTNTNSDLFYASDPQDQIRTMLRIEQFKRRYKATKVTAKMLFAVDFFSRPLDHFLSVVSVVQPQQPAPRLVTHDASQWSGPELAPGHTIRSAGDLHRVLHTIQDAASRWYPNALARVFRTVHGNATHSVPDTAPEELVHATCDLYSAVFASLFNSIQSGTHLDDLDDQATRALSRDSAPYQQFVGDVLHDAMMNSVFRSPAPRPPGRAPADRPPGRVPTDRPPSRAPQVDRRRHPPGGHAPHQFVLPPHIRALVPTANGKELCLKFQSMKDCDFRICHKEHAIMPLPPTVVAWLENRHGSLKSDHPSFQ